MKIYRRIVIVFAIVLGIAFSAFLFLTPATQMAIHDPANEEYYDYLKENAIKVAKTLDKSKVSDGTLKADFYFNENQLIVTVESMKAIVIAKIPINNQLFNIESKKIEFEGIVELENVQYETKNKLNHAWQYIGMSIGAGGLLALVLYIILVEAWVPSKKRQ